MCGKKFSLRLPQMEYTRFPGAADEPHLPQESRIFHLLGKFIPRLNKIRCAGQLIGTEGGDSCGNSMSLETP